MTTQTNEPTEILPSGTPAPDFTLSGTLLGPPDAGDDVDTTVTLSKLRGKPVVLVFYPADWSSVCGDELVVFSTARGLIERQGAVMYGISVDSVFSHSAFREAHKIKFDLLADFHPKGAVGRAYGIYDHNHGFEGRALFVIDPEGEIFWSYLSPTSVNPGVDGVLDALDRLAARSA